MRHDYHEFLARGAEILVVAPDDAQDLRAYWAAEDLPFTCLVDHDHRVADLYRQEVNLLKLGRMPSVLLVDRDGDLAVQHYGSSMADIPANRHVLNWIEQLNQAAA